MTTLSQLPVLSIEVAFKGAVLSAPGTWTDITQWCRSFDTKGGRQHELDRPEAATCSATYDDRDGRFTPYNTSSPYSSSTLGNVAWGLVPGKPFRIIATWSSVAYPIFYGFVDSWEPTSTDSLNQDCKMQATDVFKFLALAPISNLTLFPDTVLALSPLCYMRCNDAVGSSVPTDTSGHGVTATPLGAPLNTMVFGGNDVNGAQQTALLSSGYTGSGSGAILYDPATSMSVVSGIYNGVPNNAGFYVQSLTALGQSWSVSMLFQGSSGSCEGVALLTDFVSGGVELQIGIQYNPTNTGSLPPNGDLVFAFGGNPTQDLGVLVNDGLWHHLVITGTSTSFTVYLDNGLVSGPLFPGGATGPSDQSTIGTPLTISGTNLPTPSINIQEVAWFGYALNTTEINSIFSAYHMLQNTNFTGQRILEVLVIIGYHGGAFNYPTTLAVGLEVCQPETTSQTQVAALDYILNAADTELGFVYQGDDGTLFFRDQNWITSNPTSNTSQATFADNLSTQFHYFINGFKLLQDDLDLWNNIQVQAQQNGGAGQMQQVTDSSSISAFGLRVLQRTGLLFANDSEALTQATQLLARYHLPISRVQSITTGAEVNGGVCLPQMLGRSLWDQLTVGRHGPGETAFSQPILIEGKSHSYQADPGRFHTTWELSPYELL